MINPWIIVGVLLALAAAFAGGEFDGQSRGVDKQKVEDQKQFDTINAGLAKQKSDANKLYQQAQADIIALQAERDSLKGTLEKEREDNRKATDDQRAKYSGLQLRFRAAQNSGNRGNGSGTKGSSANASSSQGTAEIQLPDKIAGDLRQLAFDADTLKDDYALCYGYVEKVK